MRGESFVASDRPLGDCLGDSVLDLALGADANHLQELADAQVQSFFVHRRLLGAGSELREAHAPAAEPPGEFSLLWAIRRAALALSRHAGIVGCRNDRRDEPGILHSAGSARDLIPLAIDPTSQI